MANNTTRKDAEGFTPQQRRFVDEYLIDLNATQAAVRAKYSAKNAANIGYLLLRRPHIKAAIAQAMNERAARTGITADWVIDKLVQNVERAMQHEAVKDREGNSTGEYTYQGATANRALELLGKHIGMFTEKHEHKHTGNVKVETNDERAARYDRVGADYLARLTAVAAEDAPGSDPVLH